MIQPTNSETIISRNRKVAITALLLSLTILVQFLGRYTTGLFGPVNIFVIGTLVNALLLISVEYSGRGGAIAIACAAPITAVLSGAPIPIPFVPVIAIGNAMYVILFYITGKRVSGIILGAVSKFLFLYASVYIFLHISTVETKAAGILYFLFSWPQLVTACAGGIVYIAAIRILKRQTPHDD
ncbi:MAG: ECF transporter S component [Deltaproteobacteria bacterium]|nr:ECF transporter S component [Candidatus Zymogenaceae bacterium]